jgi:hypothetical protein
MDSRLGRLLMMSLLILSWLFIFAISVNILRDVL